MRLDALLQQVEGLRVLRARSEDLEITSIEFDSRRVEPGTLFAALVGTNTDGHDYLRQALDAGASALLIEEGRRAPDEAKTVLTAADTRRVLGELAAAFYDRPTDEVTVVGITGTNGKTTCTYLLESVFQAAGRAAGVIGTVNYRWNQHVEDAPNTTPESLVLQRLVRRMCDDGVDSVVMEVSSHGLATHRLRGTSFDVGIFTNLSQDHLDFHETMEAYRDTKARLFTELLPSRASSAEPAVAVVNVDDPEGRRLVALLESIPEVEVMRYGTHEKADVRPLDLRRTLDGIHMRVSVGGSGNGEPDEVLIETGLLGSFNVSNILATVAAARAVGVDPDAIRRGLATLTGVPGRLERIEGVGRTVFVDYAHTPDALERALETLREVMDSGELVVVFGAGGDRDRTKRPKMGEVAAQHADRVVVTSDNPRSEEPKAIIDDILGGVSNELRRKVSIEPDRQRAINSAITSGDPGDVILVAGKGHESYQEIGGIRHPFDDVEKVKNALSRLEE